MVLNYKIIGKRIQKFRLKKCLTQEKLAELANLSVSYISYIESAKKKASLESLAKISLILEVSIDSFLYGSLVCNNSHCELNFADIISNFATEEKHLIFELVASIEKYACLKN